MTDAPERIWLHIVPTGIMQANYAISENHDSSGQVEYIRADLVDAAWAERVAALDADGEEVRWAVNSAAEASK